MLCYCCVVYLVVHIYSKCCIELFFMSRRNGRGEQGISPCVSVPTATQPPAAIPPSLTLSRFFMWESTIGLYVMYICEITISC